MTDIYNRRPLPFVIGTEDFDEDDNVGLFDPEREESEEAARGAEAADDDDEEEDSSDEDTPRSELVPGDFVRPEEAGQEGVQQQQQVASIPGSEHLPEDANQQQQYDQQQQQQDQQQHQVAESVPAVGGAEMGGVAPPRSVADELAARLGVAPRQPEPVIVTPNATPTAVAMEEEEVPAASDPFAAPGGGAWGASLFDDVGNRSPGRYFCRLHHGQRHVRYRIHLFLGCCFLLCCSD